MRKGGLELGKALKNSTHPITAGRICLKTVYYILKRVKRENFKVSQPVGIIVCLKRHNCKHSDYISLPTPRIISVPYKYVKLYWEWLEARKVHFLAVTYTATTRGQVTAEALARHKVAWF